MDSATSGTEQVEEEPKAQWTTPLADAASVDVQQLLVTAIKFADLGHSAKPWNLHEQWTERITQARAPPATRAVRHLRNGWMPPTAPPHRDMLVRDDHACTQEFWALGDRERAQGWEISPLCDREVDTDVAQSQVAW